MSERAIQEGENDQKNRDEKEKDAERIETNKTDPQITELKGFFDPEEPLEEKGTLNPFTGKHKDEDS